MNNYTTARAPLRMSELSYLLAEKISQPAPPQPVVQEQPPVKAKRKPRAKK